MQQARRALPRSEGMSQDDALLRFPCVRNCCLDDDDVCLGCARTLDEIRGWNEADESERRAILARAQERRAARRRAPGQGR